MLESEGLVTQTNRETSCFCVFAINLAINNIANRPKSNVKNYRRQTNCGLWLRAANYTLIYRVYGMWVYVGCNEKTPWKRLKTDHYVYDICACLAISASTYPALSIHLPPLSLPFQLFLLF